MQYVVPIQNRHPLKCSWIHFFPGRPPLRPCRRRRRRFGCRAGGQLYRRLLRPRGDPLLWERGRKGGAFLASLSYTSDRPCLDFWEGSLVQEGGRKEKGGGGKKEEKEKGEGSGKDEWCWWSEMHSCPPSKRAQEKGEGGRLVVQWMR